MERGKLLKTLFGCLNPAVPLIHVHLDFLVIKTSNPQLNQFERDLSILKC